jgi:hypothetical protein
MISAHYASKGGYFARRQKLALSSRLIRISLPHGLFSALKAMDRCPGPPFSTKDEIPESVAPAFFDRADSYCCPVLHSHFDGGDESAASG